MSDLVFLHGGCTERCTARVDKHFDGYSTLQFITHGAVELWYEDRRHEVRGQCFWTAWPGPHIRFHCAPGHAYWTHRYVAFTGPLVNRWKAARLWPDEPQPAPGARDYAQLFDDLLAQTHRANRYGRLRAINHLESILIDLAEARSVTAPHEPWLDRVMQALDPALGFAPDYAAIATSCGMGLSTLRRRFKGATGTTLHGYALQTRIAQARDLLGSTDLPIKVIAHRLGYNDVYFFSNQFRRQAGIAPAAFRRSRQE